MDEKRVRLMTKLAILEAEDENLIQQASTYYRSDFVGAYLLKNILRGTVAFLLGLMLWGCYHMEALLDRLNTMDLSGMGKDILMVYGVMMILFLVVTYVIYSIRFLEAEKKFQTYQLMLERLEKEYERSESKEGMKRSSRGRRSGNYTQH